MLGRRCLRSILGLKFVVKMLNQAISSYHLYDIYYFEKEIHIIMIIEKVNVVLGDNHKVTLIKEKEIEYLSVDKFNTPEKIVQVLNDIFMIHKLAEEYVYLICLQICSEQ